MKAERGIDQLADDAGRFELAHPLEREHAVDVALGVASGIAEVPHAEFVAARVNAGCGDTMRPRDGSAVDRDT